jgi:hypothetical protein
MVGVSYTFPTNPKTSPMIALIPAVKGTPGQGSVAWTIRLGRTYNVEPRLNSVCVEHD